jgi:hypothetical protein
MVRDESALLAREKGMKRFLTILILITLIGTLAACSPPASGPAGTLPTHEAPEAVPEKAVVFADPALEAMVRASMGKPEGGITAAEAEAVTRLNLRIEWQRYISEETPIRDIGGLEYFKNLESLDLSFHAVTDIATLAGLKKLTSLSLDGNPVADIAPLAALTNLKVLVLSGCAAQDCSPLAKLINLDVLMLDHSAIADVSPLASLTSLKQLYLAGCPVSSYFPLSDIYQNLEQKDFTIASTLAELGFTMNDANNQASYGDVQRDGLSVNINHAEWGAPQSEDMTKCIRMDLMLDSGYTLVVLYYPEISAYVFQMNINGEQMNYIYNVADGTFMVDSNSRERFERMITEALGETGETDALLAPIPVFDDTIRETFGITADALYALPYEPPTLNNLGFVPDETNAVRVYWEHEPHDMHISIHKPEWGKNPDGSNPDGCDIEFYDHDVNGYHLLILYFADAGRYHIALFKGEEQCAFDSSAAGEYSGEYPDQDTVKRMFNDAFGTRNNNFCEKPIAYFEQLLQEHFGMSMDELYALPVGN